MIDLKMIADADQGMACMREVLAPTLKAMYDGLVEAGFSEDQAFALTRDYLCTLVPARTDQPRPQEDR